MVTQAPSFPTPSLRRSTVLVGNPNVGKSVVFGALTGRYVTVSNYAGTTVEFTRGERRDSPGVVYDLPGTNSLLPTSEDEQVTRDFLLEQLGKPGFDALQLCDAKNLPRGLVLTLQLAELEIPTVFGANMLDEARARGLTVNLDALRELLGVPTFGTVATRREGLEPLLEGTAASVPKIRVRYGPVVEEGVRLVTAHLPEDLPGKRGVALMLLTGDPTLLGWARSVVGEELGAIERIRVEIQRRVPESLRTVIDRARLRHAQNTATKVIHSPRTRQRDWLRRAGDLAMHPLWGWPIAGVVLWLTYLFVGVIGAGHAVDFLQRTVFEQTIIPWSNTALRWLLPAAVEDFFVGPPDVGLGQGPGLLVGEFGLVSMALSYAIAIVLPIVGFFFLAFSLMEDSGYLPRLAVMLNRAFRVVGLNGRAVLPMVLGLGCGTMATMTARILGTRKERLLVTLLLALAVPCSAQLGVILGMLASLSLWAAACWFGSVVLVMVWVGAVAKRLLPGHSGDFVLEVPPLRRPQLANILLKTVARIEWYLKEAVPLFALGTFVLWLLNRLNVLESLRGLAAPVVESLLGLPSQATDAFLIGFLRRDYGAAGLYAIFHERLAAGNPSAVLEIQVVVAMLTITLFVPCVANVFMIIKERGLRAGLGIAAFVFPFAFAVGGLVNLILRALVL